jgi:hypothetical protein
VLGRKSEKVIPMYAVLPSGESESRQIALFNPAQDGYFADTTVPGDDTGGEIFRVSSDNVYSQVWPPLDRSFSTLSVSVASPVSTLLLAVYVVHLINRFNEISGHTLTPLGNRKITKSEWSVTRKSHLADQNWLRGKCGRNY